MQKISLFFIFLFLQILFIPAGLFSESPREIPVVNHRYCLSYLLTEDQQELEQEIERLEEVLQSPGPDLSETELDRLRYASGALHTYRYIRVKEKNDAFRAKELLEAAETRFGNEDLFVVHIGMAHAFIARIRTIFGVSNLKEMQTKLQSIPQDHPDWLIRFLRGITSLQVGRALPGVFTIKDIKQQAVEVGSTDLHYVLKLYEESGVRSFTPSTYDFNRRPVPQAVANRARRVLEENE